MVSFCELCGKQTEINKKVMIEKTILNVCLSCSKRGKSVETTTGSITRGLSTNRNLQTTSNTTNTTFNPRITPRTRGFVPPRRRTPPRIKPAPLKKIGLVEEEFLNPDFPSIIRNARGKKGLTHEQMGQKINEKVTLLKKIETGGIKPDEILAKKLERFLGISLYINSDESINE